MSDIPLSDGIAEIRGYLGDHVTLDSSIWELIEEIAEEFLSSKYPSFGTWKC